MNTNKTILSICNRCRDGKEDDLKSRGGQRLLDNFLNRIKNNKIVNLKVFFHQFQFWLLDQNNLHLCP